MLDLAQELLLVTVGLLAVTAAFMGNAVLYLHLRVLLKKRADAARYVPIRDLADLQALSDSLARGDYTPIPSGTGAGVQDAWHDKRYDEPPEA